MSFLNIKDLQQGSFKGVPFLFVSSTETGGRKNVFYEYPNTDKRGVSDLGLDLESFTLTVYTAGSTNSDYQQNKDRLKSALRSKGPGLLVHPFVGNINCAVESYSLNENLEHLNRADFTISFKRVSEPIKPAATKNNVPKIENIAVDTTEKVSEDIENNYSVSNNNFTNFEVAKQKAQSIVTKFEEISSKVEQRTEVFNDFVVTLQEFNAQINSIIVKPTIYASKFKNLFDSLRLIASDPSERFLMFTKLFQFGAEDEVIDTNTTFQVERKANNDIINNAVNADSISYAYATLKEVSFSNESEFDRFNELLNDQWEYMQEQDLNLDVRENILTLRGEASKYIDTLNLPELVSINTIETSPTLLSYQYYGSTERDNEISTLNSLKDFGIISGDITIQGDFT